MENDLSKVLKIKHISESAKESVKYIDDRRKGLIKSLKTPWKKYNNAACGGLEWNTVHTIAGLSGSGKTAMLNQLETELFELNPAEKFDVLSFNFEMLSRNLVSRKISKATTKTVQELHSGKEDVIITDSDYENIKQHAREFAKMNIFYVEDAGTVDEIMRTIIAFKAAKQIEHNDPNRGLVVLLDHTILVKGKRDEMERVILAELYTAINYLKKKMKIIFVLLSQMNRSIESTERISEPSQQFPKKADIFGGDSCYQFSDMVSVIMNPFYMGLDYYGPHQWVTAGYLYLHIIKLREGDPCILKMINKLKFNTIEDCVDSAY